MRFPEPHLLSRIPRLCYITYRVRNLKTNDKRRRCVRNVKMLDELQFHLDSQR